MADGVAITAGAGTTIATDDITVNGVAGQVQYVKQVDGRANGTDGIPGDVNGLWTVGRKDQLEIAVNSAGLTIASTAYTAGDQVGTQFTFANAARVSGGGGIITSVLIVSAADITGGFDLALFDRSVTLAADNAAFAVSDADALFDVPLIQVAAAFDMGNNRIAQAYNIAVPYTCNGTSLFGGLITRSAHTFFAAVTDLQVSLFVERN